jgi:hypothetical protein
MYQSRHRKPIAGVMLHSVWIGAMLEVAATLTLVKAAQ